MKRVYRRSQIRKILGRPVFGPDFHRYGIPYNGAGGSIDPKESEHLVDYLLAAAERFSTLVHIVSFLNDGRILNRYDENARFFMLYTGDSDPSIEFSTEVSKEDFCTDHPLNYSVLEMPDFEPSRSQMMAIDWSLNRILKR